MKVWHRELVFVHADAQGYLKRCSKANPSQNNEEVQAKMSNNDP